MAVPNRHIAKLSLLTKYELAELTALVIKMQELIQKRLKPEGFNIGMNIGRCAGAGVPGHLHIHIVPRWNGDTNFMPTASDTKVVSQSLEAAYKLLKKIK